ncbi:patatin-like phospholipase family protein [Alkalihalophilus sp. As8PL]|uniref:Patatin-like phospholipase family protein n=2 Tax=Alkalihalophilus TaxID=2893060 RepID=A0AB39BRG7_9BACI|nr:patatin-like phospholipase family protein [Alkalihalophilus lindianensis]MDV2685129.1 patatin-like phospholipase family protein [Alkalihalophilus lindianensis]
MKIDGVFAGGGVKAYAFVGALDVMEERGYEFTRIAGTSAGSIVAALIKAGYTSKELLSLLNELDIEAFKDERMSWLPFPVAKWIHMYFKLGIYKGDALEAWLSCVLQKKGIKTFADLPKDSLRIIASDLSQNRLIVLPDDLPLYGQIPEKFSVARAVRMSCSIPFFFEPVKIYDRTKNGARSYVVDGGILSNFPMWLFMDGKTKKWRRPVIGFQLSPSLDQVQPNDIKNAIALYRALFDTMTKAHDTRYIAADHAKNIVFIPVMDVSATDFEMSEQEKEKLMNLGRIETEQFLRGWRY